MAWKFEFFNSLGEKTFKYWQNEISDDFLRYIPTYLMATPEDFQDPKGSGNWTIYAFDKMVDKLYDHYIGQDHRINLETPGEIIFERYQPGIYSAGEEVDKKEYLLRKKEREALFNIEISEPDWRQETRTDLNLDADGISHPIEVPFGDFFTIIKPEDELANPRALIDAQFIGVKLEIDPYNKTNWDDPELEFKGNFSDDQKKLIKKNLFDNKDGLRLINKHVLKI